LIPGLHDATELNNNSKFKLGDIHYQIEPNLSIFAEDDLINDDSCFCSQILSKIDCHDFSFWKAFIKCVSLTVNDIFDDARYDVFSMLLQCWAVL